MVDKSNLADNGLINLFIRSQKGESINMVAPTDWSHSYRKRDKL